MKKTDFECEECKKTPCITRIKILASGQYQWVCDDCFEKEEKFILFSWSKKLFKKFKKSDDFCVDENVLMFNSEKFSEYLAIISDFRNCYGYDTRGWAIGGWDFYTRIYCPNVKKLPECITNDWGAFLLKKIK